MIMRLAARAVGILAVAVGAIAVGAADSPRTLVFPRLNQTYRDVSPRLEPISAAGLTVRLQSPTNSLTVRSHRLELEPMADDTVRFAATLSLLGKAQLLAAVDAGGTPAELSDEVLLPIQDLALAGRAAVRRTAEGYEVTPQELPSHLEVAIQSRLAGQLAALCDLSSVLVPGLECGGLEQAMSRVRLPLPAPGETYFVAATELTPEEVAELDAALGTTPPAAGE